MQIYEGWMAAEWLNDFPNENLPRTQIPHKINCLHFDAVYVVCCRVRSIRIDGYSVEASYFVGFSIFKIEQWTIFRHALY